MLFSRSFKIKNLSCRHRKQFLGAVFRALRCFTVQFDWNIFCMPWIYSGYGIWSHTKHNRQKKTHCGLTLHLVKMSGRTVKKNIARDFLQLIDKHFDTHTAQ